MLGGYDGSILSIHKGVGDEKRIAFYLFYLHIGQVVGVSLLGDAANQFHGDLFTKHQRLAVFLQSFDQPAFVVL